MIGTFDVNYHEGDQDTYMGMTFKLIVGTGDPVTDWTILQEAVQAIRDCGIPIHTMLKSSCDHFVRDGEQCRWENSMLVYNEPERNGL